jgi:hypothetical protein
MSKMKRREFIVGGATAAVGLTCLSKGIREAIAAAQRTGKPLLTENNLNAFIKANPLRLRKGQDVSAEAIRDLNGFIQRRFHLTEAQSRELASLSAEDKSKLTDAIKDMRAKKGSISVRIVPAGSGAEQDLREAHHAVPNPLKIDITGGHSDDLGWYIKVTVSK